MDKTTSSPWAISVAQLAQHAGQSKAIDIDFPAPSGIGDDIVGVREGDLIHMQANIDSIVDGLILNAHVSAPMHAVCTRCLKPLSNSKELDIVAFYPYDMKEIDESEGDLEIVAGEDEADDGNTYPLAAGGTVLDVETLLRDNLVESIPLKVLCKPDCKGLCSQCGVNLNENPDHHHDTSDDRWAILEDLKAQLEHKEETTK
ncbi:YceD family protein [Bombiscardovia coagulans]|uniref:DNA-binding protein n=1 Tax=Bombiscardovia coagulans TaxID=686666 RepID=A0A261EUX1_9BIFI|nr:DUF177 domain-containing protein [Bombiscardovia coagulans]OZG50664.1 DNA-binding protein [Bombiscardovia coagulans]